MTRNHVAANLLMLFFIVGGFLMSLQIKQEVFPEFELDLITVSIPYPGASPQDVEEGAILAIEDEVRGVDGVKSVKSISLENSGTVTIELLRGADSGKTLQDVKNVVDRIQSFPEEAERPIVSLVEARRQVISLMIYGDQDRRVLRDLAERVRDELIEREGITLVELANVPPLEIAVEVPERKLRAYNLTLDEIAGTIRQTALDLPGGAVKAPNGEVLLRTKERRDFASQFGDIPVVSNQDGSKIILQEIADLQEGFEDTDQEAFFDGKPAIRVDVYRVGDQTPMGISAEVREYIKEAQETLPESVKMATWNDSSEAFRDRIDLLVRNAGLGLVLVLILLGLFLEPRLAFWVTIGIPISIIGSFIFVPFTAASINMIALFAFIVTLGIVVDDAIVVGENIYQKREEGMSHLEASIVGAKEISVPVVFAIMTNIAAFIPLFFVPGSIGKIFMQIPAVVVVVLLISLIESLYVLPSHLVTRRENPFWKKIGRPSVVVEKWLHYFIDHVYVRQLRWALRNRYLTVASGIALLIVSVGCVLGGIIQFSYLPRIDMDLVTSQAVLPFGIPIEKSREIQQRIVQAAQKVVERNGGDISRGIYTQVGTAIPGGGPALGARTGEIGSHLVGIQVFLVPSDQRKLSGVEFAKEWREELGEIPGVETISFSAQVTTGGGPPIEIELSHRDRQLLEQASQELAVQLRSYNGVDDIDDGVTVGKPQMNFRLKPEARSLGIKVRDLANQVRASFYGAEALRQQRGRNEVKVMVRLPEEERKTVYTAEELILRTPDGGEIPLKEAADVNLGRSYTSIRRSEGRRVLSVTADVDENVANANEILGDIEENVLPAILHKYRGLSYGLEGQQKDQRESIEALSIGFAFAMIAIYTLLAVPFKSYFQPAIVMTSIPFGIIGAMIGHWLLGYELSIISMFGIIALTGVVVNDSLVLVVTTNRMRRDGMAVFDAIIKAGAKRFRPIILTSLTTFFGLAPMIFETSMQARFLIPMAVSLGFGVLFSTFIVLLLVPAFYLILEDIPLFREEIDS